MYKQARRLKKGLYIKIPPKRDLVPYTLEQEHLFELETKVDILNEKIDILKNRKKLTIFQIIIQIALILLLVF